MKFFRINKERRESMEMDTFQEFYDHESQDNLTALHVMCKNTNVKIQSVREAIKFRPSLVDATTSKGGDTPLHYAVAAGDKKVIKYVLKKGPQAAKVQSNEASAFGYMVTPLHVAIMKEASVEVIQAIVYACPASLNVCDGNGNPPLLLAKEHYGDDERVMDILSPRAGRMPDRKSVEMSSTSTMSLSLRSNLSTTGNYMLSSRSLALSIDSISKDASMDSLEQEVVVSY